MNTRQVIDYSSGPQSLSVSFNQDNSCFAVGMDTGFCVFNTEPFELRTSRDFNAGVGAVEMLGRHNYVGLVGGGKQPRFPPNKAIIWNEAKQSVAITLEFLSQVTRIRLSRTRIVVVLRHSVHLYSFASPPEKLSTFETADNPLGLCCLGANCVAFPGRTAGQVQLVDLERGNVSIIPAHAASLRAMDLSQDGEFLATASETGTLIRVFSTRNCSRIAELRRGVEQAIIFSIAISPSGSLLAATSDKSTLHIFDLAQKPQSSAQRRSASPHSPSSASSPHRKEDEQVNKWGVLSKIPLMPRFFSDVYSVTTAHFEMGDEQPVRSTGAGVTANAIATGIPGGKPPKGVIGWVDDISLVVLGAGQDARWEKFLIGESDDGKRYCVRDGWRRYLGNG